MAHGYATWKTLACASQEDSNSLVTTAAARRTTNQTCLGQTASTSTSNRLATRPIIACVSHAVIFSLGSYLYIRKMSRRGVSLYVGRLRSKTMLDAAALHALLPRYFTYPTAVKFIHGVPSCTKVAVFSLLTSRGRSFSIVKYIRTNFQRADEVRGMRRRLGLLSILSPITDTENTVTSDPCRLVQLRPVTPSYRKHLPHPHHSDIALQFPSHLLHQDQRINRIGCCSDRLSSNTAY